MRYLTLIRHAKSSWDDPSLDDFERPLNARGRRDAPLMATRAALMAGRPQCWISSPARRAIETARCFADTLGVASEQIVIQSALYHASVDQLLAVLQALRTSGDQVWLFGHNPGLSEFGRWLCPQAPAEMPTCAVAQYALAGDGTVPLTSGTAHLRCYLYPKQAQLR